MRPKFIVVTGRQKNEITKYVVTERGMYEHPIGECTWLIYWASIRKNVRLMDESSEAYPGYSVRLRQVAYDFGYEQNTLFNQNDFVRVPIESYIAGSGHIGCVEFDQENWTAILRQTGLCL
jgi:hypothetical protein